MGEFNQLLNLADVDNKQQNLQSKTLPSSSLYDFEVKRQQFLFLLCIIIITSIYFFVYLSQTSTKKMNQLLYFTKHSSVASLLADPLLKPIRWPADENDPQQKMLWHIYELLGKEGDGSGDSVKIEPKEEENEVKQLQPDEDLFCTCAQTSSSSTDLDTTTSVDQHQQQLSSPPNKMGSSKKKAKLSFPEKKKKKVSLPEKRTLENLEASPRARRRRRRRLVEPVLPSLTIEEDEQSKAKKEKKARREHRKLHRMGKKTKKMKKEGKALDLGVFTTTSSPAPSTLIAAAE